AGCHVGFCAGLGRLTESGHDAASQCHFLADRRCGANVTADAQPTELRGLWRSVMCTPVLTKASAIESIKCCVSLQKERFAFTLLRLTRRIVLSNQEGGRKRAPSVCNVHLLA